MEGSSDYVELLPAIEPTQDEQTTPSDVMTAAPNGNMSDSGSSDYVELLPAIEPTQDERTTPSDVMTATPNGNMSDSGSSDYVELLPAIEPTQDERTTPSDVMTATPNGNMESDSGSSDYVELLPAIEPTQDEQTTPSDVMTATPNGNMESDSGSSDYVELLPAIEPTQDEQMTPSDVMTATPNGNMESDSVQPNDETPAAQPSTSTSTSEDGNTRQPQAPKPSNDSLESQSATAFNLKVYQVVIRRLAEEVIDIYLSIRDIGPLIRRCPIPGQRKKRKLVDEDYDPQPSTSGNKKQPLPSTIKSAVYMSHKQPLKKDERELSWLNFYNKVKRFIKPHEKKGARAYWESMAFKKQRKHIPWSPHDEIMSLYRRRGQRPG